MVGRTTKDILDPETFERISAHDLEVIQENKVTQRVEPVPLADGQVRYYLIHRFPLRGPRTERWLGAIALDVTERHNAEGRIRELARELEAAGRLKDQFLSNLSHELRTPITAIRLWVDVLKGAGPDDLQTVRDAAEMISESVASQTRLIEDLLDVTRILAGKLKIELRPTALDSELRRAVVLLEPVARERGVALELIRPPRPARILGDAKRLQQVVWNLLSNAIKFSNPGGTIRVSLEPKDSQWMLQIADNGIGISAELLPHLFERFRQADTSRSRSEGGVGIGLSLVKYLVEAQGGSVTAASDGEGKGSLFTVLLPEISDASVEAEPSTTAPAPASPVTPQALAGKTILLVEDNADSRTGLMLLLRRSGATVQAVENVEQALAAEGAFDALLSDIGLPGRDGCELIAELRERPQWKQIPALAISAYAMPEDRERAMTVGFDDFLVKPVEPEELIAKTAEWITRGRMKAEG
jgi:signal transduction histidine kinase